MFKPKPRTGLLSFSALAFSALSLCTFSLLVPGCSSDSGYQRTDSARRDVRQAPSPSSSADGVASADGDAAGNEPSAAEQQKRPSTEARTPESKRVAVRRPAPSVQDRTHVGRRVAREEAPALSGEAHLFDDDGEEGAENTRLGMMRSGSASKNETEDERVAQPDPITAANPGGTFVHEGFNVFTLAEEDRLSTFAIDVDTASYTYGRRFLKSGQKPNPASVRVEEWINAFHYNYRSPKGEHPFAIHLEAGPSPILPGAVLLRVGIQGQRVAAENRKPVHLTFLVDVSGSMSAADKLPLIKESLGVLLNNLNDDDSVSLVTYAGATQVVLPQTRVREQRWKISAAIASLSTAGGTYMSSGMVLAYQNAHLFLGQGSESRVIVLSDGDANIGRTTQREMLAAVQGYVSEGVTLSTVGFGTGNYRDHLMEQLADAGNGNYSYIDSLAAAKKVFGTDLTSTLQVIAKDVKIQVEMNPALVKSYRLLGYENRAIADRDFRNDRVDAGEIGAGHAVTALYEIELQAGAGQDQAGDLATVRVRYKQPRGEVATEVAQVFAVKNIRRSFNHLSHNTRFAAAASLTAELLRHSPYTGELTFADALLLARQAAAGDRPAERRELVELLEVATANHPVAYR